MEKNATQALEYATFTERVKPAFMDYFGPWFLFFVGGLLQAPFMSIGIISNILGGFCVLLGLAALLLINGYVPTLNRGQTPNKMQNGVKIMKIVDKSTMELREITDDDMAIMLVRAFIGWFEIFILIIPGIIPLLVINSSKYKQRLADMIAGTVMVKVEPIEKVDLKTLRKKPSDSYPDGFAVPSTKFTEESEGTTISTQRFAEGTFTSSMTSLLSIGKVLILIAAMTLIICNIIIIAFQINNSTVFSINIFGGVAYLQLWFYVFTRIFIIISYIANFILLGSLVLVTLSLPSEHKSSYFLASVFFFVYILLWIIGGEVYEGGKLFAYIDFGLGSIGIVTVYLTNFIIQFNLALIALVVSIFMINKGFKSLEKAGLVKPTQMYSNIFLIVMILIYLIITIIGLIAQPEDIFGVVMYYLLVLSRIILLCALISFSVGILKIRRIAT